MHAVVVVIAAVSVAVALAAGASPLIVASLLGAISLFAVYRAIASRRSW